MEITQQTIAAVLQGLAATPRRIDAVVRGLSPDNCRPKRMKKAGPQWKFWPICVGVSM